MSSSIGLQALFFEKPLVAVGWSHLVPFATIAGMAAYFADDYDTAEKYLALADKAGKLDEEGKEALTELPKTKELFAKEQAIRAKEKEADDLP